MARIFITGSADGLGQLAAKTLIQQGHQVVLHARNGKRGDEALMSVSGAAGVVTGDLSVVEQTKKVAEEVNTLGTFDAIIHNAGVYRSTAKEIFSVNTIAPYILTCLIKKPERLIYLSSDMYLQGHFELRDLLNDHHNVTYSDSKLHIVMLCLAVARKWPQVYANAVNPGWVPTKMGGRGAPDDLEKGYDTQVWLATSNEPSAKVSGRYFYHKKDTRLNAQAKNEQAQEAFLNALHNMTGISLPQ